MKTGYLCLIGLLVCLLLSCSVQTGICRLEDHYNCIPVRSYIKWNQCINDCSGVKIQSKTKPYKKDDLKWIRPRPYAYP